MKKFHNLIFMVVLLSSAFSGTANAQRLPDDWFGMPYYKFLADYTDKRVCRVASVEECTCVNLTPYGLSTSWSNCLAKLNEVYGPYCSGVVVTLTVSSGGFCESAEFLITLPGGQWVKQ